MTAPADCPARRERPQAITVTLLISGIKKQFVSLMGGKGNPPSVARHSVSAPTNKGCSALFDLQLYRKSTAGLAVQVRRQSLNHQERR